MLGGDDGGGQDHGGVRAGLPPRLAPSRLRRPGGGARTGRTVREICRSRRRGPLPPPGDRGPPGRPGDDPRPRWSPRPAASSRGSNRGLLREPTRWCGCGRGAGAGEEGRLGAGHRPLLADDPPGRPWPASTPSAPRCTPRWPRVVDVDDLDVRQVVDVINSAARTGAGYGDHRPRRLGRGSYPVLVVTAPATSWRGPAGGRGQGGRRHPGRHRGRGRPRRGAQTFTIEPGSRTSRWPPSRSCAGAGPGGASPGPTRWWPSAAEWSPTWPGSRPRCTTGASPSCTCPPPCSAWSTPPSAARPGSTCRRARTWWAPSGSRRRCCATPRCWLPCRPASTAAAWARWPSTPSSAWTTCPTCPSTRPWRLRALQGRPRGRRRA